MNSFELKKIREEEIDQFERRSNDDFARRVAAAVEARSDATAEAQRRRSALAEMSDRVVSVRRAQGGSRVYHSSQFCGCMRRRDGLGEYQPMFEEEADARGYVACRRCNHSPLRRTA